MRRLLVGMIAFPCNFVLGLGHRRFSPSRSPLSARGRLSSSVRAFVYCAGIEFRHSQTSRPARTSINAGVAHAACKRAAATFCRRCFFFFKAIRLPAFYCLPPSQPKLIEYFAFGVFVFFLLITPFFWTKKFIKCKTCEFRVFHSLGV